MREVKIEKLHACPLGNLATDLVVNLTCYYLEQALRPGPLLRYGASVGVTFQGLGVK